MSHSASYFENASSIFISKISDDEGLIEIDGQKMVMSYDAVYELALRLSRLVEKLSEPCSDSCAQIN